MISTQQLNYFTAKGEISPYNHKHCQIAFGANVQANNEPHPTSTNALHSIDCIYLRPVSNIQGGHKMMDLHTRRVITKRRIMETPLTELMLEGLKLDANSFANKII
jgi:hypothetical protein